MLRSAYADRNFNGYAHADAYSHRHAIAYLDSYPHRHAVAYSYSHAHRHAVAYSDSYPHRHAIAYSDSYPHRHAIAYPDSHAYRHAIAYPDFDSQSYANASDHRFARRAFGHHRGRIRPAARRLVEAGRGRDGLQGRGAIDERGGAFRMDGAPGGVAALCHRGTVDGDERAGVRGSSGVHQCRRAVRVVGLGFGDGTCPSSCSS